MNLDAFEWGRRAAAEPERRRRPHGRADRSRRRRATSRETLDEMIARRVAFLDRLPERRLCRALPRRRSSACARPRRSTVANSTALTEAVARSLFTLMAYKDEYEVARLYTDGHFEKQVAATFEGENLRYEFHLAPPLLARKRPGDGLAAQDELRALDAEGLRGPREAEGPARHAVRRLRLHP